MKKKIKITISIDTVAIKEYIINRIVKYIAKKIISYKK